MAVATLARPAYSPEQLRSLLGQIVDERRVLVRPIDVIAYASDASFYRLIPKAVVQAASEEEVARLFEFSHELAIPITFRAAGTSLSGQAISDGLLVEIARNFRDRQVLENGRKIRVQPGLIGANANRALLPSEPETWSGAARPACARPLPRPPAPATGAVPDSPPPRCAAPPRAPRSFAGRRGASPTRALGVPRPPQWNPED